MRHLPAAFLLVSIGLPLAASSGCSSSSPEVAPEAPPGPGIQAPRPVPGAPVGHGPGVVFAIRRFHLPDQNADGSQNPTDGWKSIGFDIDGTATTADPSTMTDLCQPAAGGAKSIVDPDGDDGIDNSFGHLVYDNIVHGVASTASQFVEAAVASGDSTLLLAVHGLGTGSSYSGLTADTYLAAPLGHAPRFDGADRWPVRPESLTKAGDLASASSHLVGGYVTSGTWVSGAPGGTVEVVLPLGSLGPLHLTIHHAQVAMHLDARHRSATGGTIAGVLDPSELVAEAHRLIAHYQPDLCRYNVDNALRASADILLDGTQDPTKTCDGISIGLGFDASAVELGGVGPAAVEPPLTDPAAGCLPCGTVEQGITGLGCDTGECCGGACVDTTHDPRNCGGCGIQCGGSEPVCGQVSEPGPSSGWETLVTSCVPAGVSP